MSANVVSYADTMVAAGSRYYYRVCAWNTGGNSAWSNSAEILTPAAPPAAPSGLKASATSRTLVNLTWTDNAANESGFTVQRSLDGKQWTTVAAPLGANVTTWSDNTVQANKQYQYRLQAWNGGGVSTWSNVAKVRTPR